MFRTWRNLRNQVVEGKRGGSDLKTKTGVEVGLKGGMAAGVLKREVGEIQDTWKEALQREVMSTRAAAGPERLKGGMAQGVGSGGEV